MNFLRNWCNLCIAIRRISIRQRLMNFYFFFFFFAVPWTREAYFAAKIVRSRKWTRFTCTGIGVRLQWSEIKAHVTGNLTGKKKHKQSLNFGREKRVVLISFEIRGRRGRTSSFAWHSLIYCATSALPWSISKIAGTCNISTPITQTFSNHWNVWRYKESETAVKIIEPHTKHAKISSQSTFLLRIHVKIMYFPSFSK